MTSDAQPSTLIPPPLTREKLLALARELAHTHGESLTLTVVLRESGLTRTLLLKLCGSWCELRTAIGLTPDGPHSRTTLSNAAIVDKLRAAIAQHGENITQVLFCRLTGYATTLLAHRFGSWGQLRQSAGIAPRAKMQNRYTDQEIFDDILQVVSRIHRPPTYNGYKRNGGKISTQTLRDRFGGWQKVIYAFEDELDRRSPGRPQPRYRPDPRNPLVFYVFLCGKPLYYVVYDSPDLTTGTKTPLPPDFTL